MSDYEIVNLNVKMTRKAKEEFRDLCRNREVSMGQYAAEIIAHKVKQAKQLPCGQNGKQPPMTYEKIISELQDMAMESKRSLNEGGIQ